MYSVCPTPEIVCYANDWRSKTLWSVTLKIIFWLESALYSKGKDFQTTMMVAGNLPQFFIKQDGKVVLNEKIKNIDDLKMFLEDRFYKYLKA